MAHKRSRQVSDRLVKGIGFLFKKNGVTHIKGAATLTGPKQVQVAPSGDVLTAKTIIIATGARPRSLPGMTVDGQKIITYRQALELTAAPKRLIVVGAGAIGMEFAYVFRAYGAEVTVIEMLPHVLPLEDDDTAAEVAKAFKKGRHQGAGQHPHRGRGDRPTRASRCASRTRPAARSRPWRPTWCWWPSASRPTREDIGLEAAGVQTDKRGFIVVDDHMRTNVPGVYAIGDVTGKLMLAHVASAMGIVAAEHVAGHETRPIKDADYAFMPRCTYCKPQVARWATPRRRRRRRATRSRSASSPSWPTARRWA